MKTYFDSRKCYLWTHFIGNARNKININVYLKFLYIAQTNTVLHNLINNLRLKNKDSYLTTVIILFFKCMFVFYIFIIYAGMYNRYWHTHVYPERQLIDCSIPVTSRLSGQSRRAILGLQPLHFAENLISTVSSNGLIY